jgi:hypothetical protein
MGMVDTLMVGRISPEAIGAVGLGSSIFMGVCIFAMGLLLGLDTLVSQAYGAKNIDACHRWLVHGVVLAVVLSVPITGVLLWIAAGLDSWGIDPGVLVLATPYVRVVSWSVLPLLLYAAFRRYLQGMGVVRPITIALVGANLVNVFVNWILIYGNLGAPAMGVPGAAWATVLSRVAMAAFLFGTIMYRERGSSSSVFTSLKLERAWFGRLLTLGIPAASQVTLEVGAFAAATALAGRLAPAALAAHQIAINYAALTRRPCRWAARCPGSGTCGLDGAALCGAVHVGRRRLIPVHAAPAAAGIHVRSAGARGRRRPPAHRGGIPALRRSAGSCNWSIARHRRYADAHAVESRGTLVHRIAPWLLPLFPAEDRGHGPLVGTLHRPDHLWRGAVHRLDPPDPSARA